MSSPPVSTTPSSAIAARRDTPRTDLRDAGHVVTDERVRELADELAGVAGVVGVMLGGSRARGDHTSASDVDLGLYYRPPLDVAGLRTVARAVTGRDDVVTEPGEWGPWVDGGAWTTLDESAVDWIYRDVDRVRRSCQDATAGRFEFFAQVGHPLGVTTVWYAGEVALGVVLADPTGELVRMQELARPYPPALRDAIVTRSLWEAGFCLDIAAKSVSRADSCYVAGCLFRAVLLCAHALMAHARQWCVNEKGAVAAAGRLAGAPESFTRRASKMCASMGSGPRELAATLISARQLLEETASACQVK
jgi:hypothetical protein